MPVCLYPLAQSHRTCINMAVKGGPIPPLWNMKRPRTVCGWPSSASLCSWTSMLILWPFADFVLSDIIIFVLKKHSWSHSRSPQFWMHTLRVTNQRTAQWKSKPKRTSILFSIRWGWFDIESDIETNGMIGRKQFPIMWTFPTNSFLQILFTPILTYAFG